MVKGAGIEPLRLALGGRERRDAIDRRSLNAGAHVLDGYGPPWARQRDRTRDPSYRRDGFRRSHRDVGFH